MKSSIVKIFLLILLFNALFFTFAYATEFSDLNMETEDGLKVQKMVDEQIINGYPDGTFRPDNYIKRSECIKIINKTFNFTKRSETVEFLDVGKNDWFYEDLLISLKNNYISGFTDNTFRPNKYITREQFCKILTNVLEIKELPFDKDISDNVSKWAVPYVNAVVSCRIMLLEDNNVFRATENITRIEVCKVLSNYIVEDQTNNSENTNDDNADSLEVVLNRVSEKLVNNCIPVLNDELQIEICEDIYDNIQKYISDNNFDYKTEAEKVYKKFLKLSDEQQEELKESILTYNTLNDLIELKEWFFPNIDL
ncbi:S-layer homology domain-containing protein [Sedimentibacter sp. zth1]|uniref:S-layer homology domain-containing protein n=1 Tax=Sedimentibacter sp. zth1 TaxID=2816908 RepID=UPI001A927C2D|nr:S-layer homology domain-containing protein [Sedimentibacter sp. zth1]QSX05264.1 S-layer homology domain-containing protein [Sedimentibacter sp. zth1]